jgi:hypothetical protein
MSPKRFKLLLTEFGGRDHPTPPEFDEDSNNNLGTDKAHRSCLVSLEINYILGAETIKMANFRSRQYVHPRQIAAKHIE